MGKIKVESCEIEGLKVITPTVFGDERGYFMETYNYNDFKEAGIDVQFVQDNQSASKKGGTYIYKVETAAQKKMFHGADYVFMGRSSERCKQSIFCARARSVPCPPPVRG